MLDFNCLKPKDIHSFDWDDGNTNKNKTKYGLDCRTIEEIFFNEPLVGEDEAHSTDKECRCYVLGKTMMVFCYLSFSL